MEFINFAQAHGLVINHIQIGKWVRVPTQDHPHKRNGAYFFGGDYAHVQNWATMEATETWMLDKPMTEPEKIDLQFRIKKSQEEHAKERLKDNQEAAGKARWILGQCELDKHAYMDSKGFPDTFVNVWRKPDQNPLMVIPMFYKDEVCGVQLIDIDGNKKFLTGQRTNLAHFKIGQGKNIFLVEGYASGLSLQVILASLKVDYTIYICFSAGNVKKIANKLQNAKIICDHDKSNTSQKIALESGLKHFIPPQCGHDINDMLNEIGLFKCTMLLKSFVYQV